MDIDTVDTGGTNPGNTKGIRARGWVFTLNNWSEEEYDTLTQLFYNESDSFIIGKEIAPTTGTPHLQGYVYFSNPRYFNALKDINKRIRWAKAKGTKQQNANYCGEDGQYLSHNMPTVKPKKKKKSLSETLNRFKQEVLSDEYNNDNVTWKPFQDLLLNIINNKPNNRWIYWFYENKGNTGKTYIEKYIACKYNVILMDGKKDNIFHQVFKHIEDTQTMPEICIANVTRNGLEYINYDVLENLKDGVIFSGKYEGGKLIFKHPHVICLSNHLPDINSLSLDRWIIYEIINGNPIPKDVEDLIPKNIENINNIKIY